MTKKRILYALAFFCLLCVEIVIALFVHDAFIRPYIGDVLVVILIYCLIRTVIPEKQKCLPAYVFAFACFTELMQYLHIVELLGLSENAFFRVLIGSVFDWSDILAYLAGCILLGAWEIYAACRRQKPVL